MSATLADSYRASMKTHPYGYAFFEPQLYGSLRPGVCGYIDEYRHWCPIIDLTDNEVLENNNYTPMYPLQRSEPGKLRWGPLEASTSFRGSNRVGVMEVLVVYKYIEI
jgi:hypothetical protein